MKFMEVGKGGLQALFMLEGVVSCGMDEVEGYLAHSFGQGSGCKVVSWHVHLARAGGMRWRRLLGFTSL